MENENVKFKIFRWGTWPYWVRGGTVGVACSIILAGADLNYFWCVDFMHKTFWGGQSLPLWCHIAYPGAFLSIVWLGLILFFFTWFVYGGLLGWLYSKVKNRKFRKAENQWTFVFLTASS